MILKLATAAAATALVIVAPAQARQHATAHRWQAMTLDQKRQLVGREIDRRRSTVRWWVTNRDRIVRTLDVRVRYCVDLGVPTTGAVCVAGHHLTRALRTRDVLEARRVALLERRLLDVAGRDFATAARFADRVFPGTYGWLTSCSSSEGGHGAWVPNARGSGAGGWMQFMSGTFYGNVDEAFAAARARGFHVPAQARSWYSTVGQAVTAAWMRWTGRDRGQWTGRAC